MGTVEEAAAEIRAYLKDLDARIAGLEDERKVLKQALRALDPRGRPPKQ